MQLRVERLEQPAAQPRVLSVDVNFLGAFLTISAIFLPPDPIRAPSARARLYL